MSMKRRQKRARRLSFRSEESALRAIVMKLGPMDQEGLPEDEYDCLVHHLLSSLHRGVDRGGLRQEAEFHLREHFGFDAGESLQTADRIAEATWTWWSNRPSIERTDA
jgi:hypothetical protein